MLLLNVSKCAQILPVFPSPQAASSMTKTTRAIKTYQDSDDSSDSDSSIFKHIQAYSSISAQQSMPKAAARNASGISNHNLLTMLP